MEILQCVLFAHMVFDLKHIIQTMTIFVFAPGNKPREGYVSQ